VYQEQALLHNRRATMVFAADVAHIGSLVQAFANAGILARGVHGSTPEAERHAVLDDFASGRLPVLINCGVLTEGVDIPHTDCILLARPTKSSVLLQQIIGRGLRLAPDKQYCLVLDFVDVNPHDIQRATVPSLLGCERSMLRERAFTLIKRDGTEVDEQPDPVAVPASAPLDLRALTYALNMAESPFANAPTSSLPGDIAPLAKMTALAWIPTDKQHWMLPYLVPKWDGGKPWAGSKFSLHIRLQPPDDSSSVPRRSEVFRRRLLQHQPGSYVTETRKLFEHDQLQSAFHAAETYLKAEIPYLTFLELHRFSPRRTRAATPKQLALLAKLDLGPVPADATHTHGAASDLIELCKRRRSRPKKGGKNIK
jgi:hypothetical protein